VNDKCLEAYERYLPNVTVQILLLLACFRRYWPEILIRWIAILNYIYRDRSQTAQICQNMDLHYKTNVFFHIPYNLLSIIRQCYSKLNNVSLLANETSLYQFYLLILQSFDWLAAFHLELLQAIYFIAV
jgi:hypothetical protein